MPKDAQADGLCQPNGLPGSVGTIAGRVCWIEASCSLVCSDGLALTTSAAAAAGSPRTSRSPRVSACMKARRSWPRLRASSARTTSTSSSYVGTPARSTGIVSGLLCSCCSCSDS